MDNDAWHLDKRWHITQIVALVCSVLMGAAYVVQRDGQYDKRMALIENTQYQQREKESAQRDRDMQQDRDFTYSIELVRKQLDRIEVKLDRASDRDFQLNEKRKP